MSEDEDPLEKLSSKELHDLAIGHAARHVDIRFFVNLAEYLPTAEAAAGETGEFEADVMQQADVPQLVSHIDDITDSGQGEVAELLRPFYVEYLEKHHVRP